MASAATSANPEPARKNCPLVAQENTIVPSEGPEESQSKRLLSDEDGARLVSRSQRRMNGWQRQKGAKRDSQRGEQPTLKRRPDLEALTIFQTPPPVVFQWSIGVCKVRRDRYSVHRGSGKRDQDSDRLQAMVCGNRVTDN